MKYTTLLNSFVLTIGLSLVGSTIHAQTGPGGIRNASEIEIWLDASDITGTGAGATFATWPDRSGNGNNFVQGTSARQPQYNVGGLNGKPYVFFYGDYMDSPPIPDLETRNISWLFVGEFTATGGSAEVAINQNYDSYRYAQYLTQYDAGTNTIEQTTWAIGEKPLPYGATAGTRIFFAERNENNFFAVENDQLVAFRSDLNTTTTPTGHNYCRLGMRAGNLLVWPFKGTMYEVMVISDNLSSAEIVILNNYLAAKYGLAIGDDFYAYESGYGENVIGIGQEFDGNNLTATGRGIVTISNATQMDNGDYFFLGDDNVNLGNISSNVPAALVGYERFERLWRVDEEGDVGDVTITLDLNIYAPGPTGASTVMLVGNSADMSTATAVAGVYDVGANTISFTYTPNPGDFISFAAEDQDIFSVNTGNWADVNTWSCLCIPTANDSVTISTGDIVTVSSVRAARTILVQSGGALDVNGGGISISGDLQALGGFDVTYGTVNFNGSGFQTMQLSEDAIIDNINASSGSGLTISGLTNVTVNGTFDVNTDIDNLATNLIINSSANGDGRIGQTTGFTFSGPITVRRFLPAGDAEYREVTPLTFNFQFQQWDDDVIISGSGFPDGCAQQNGSCYFSVKSYDGTNFQDVTSLTTNYGGFKGYRMWMGDDLTTFSGDTLGSTGSIKSGSILGVGHDEWNFVGNSYPSAIDFELLRAASTNMDYYFYIYNPNSASYDWYDAGATGSLDQYIAMGQGFWVKSSNGNPVVLSMNESHKTPSSATFMRPDQLSGLIMSIGSEKNSYSSKIAFNTHPLTTVFSDERDMEYLPTQENLAPHLAALNEYGKEMTVNYFNPDASEAVYSLVCEVPAVGYYTIDVENLKNLDQYSCIYLVDLKTNEVINLREETSYTFYADVMKSEEPRFVVSFSNECEQNDEPVLSTIDEASEEDNIKVSNAFGNIQVQFDFSETKDVDINVTNSLGQLVHRVESVNFQKGVHTFNVDATGVLFVNFFYDNKSVTKKIFLR